VGTRLFERAPGGVRLTAAGATMLRHASAALDEVDRAERLLHGPAPVGGTVRLGLFSSIGAALLPEALSLMRHRAPDVEVVTREGSTAALTRSLRAATLDLAVISSRPPYPPPDDDQDPPLELEVLLEGELLVAVPARGQFGQSGAVTLLELQHERWISSPEVAGEPALGCLSRVVKLAEPGYLCCLGARAFGHPGRAQARAAAGPRSEVATPTSGT